MREQINAALTEAVKAKDKLRVSTLRLINAAIKDRDIAARSADNSDGVSDAEILDILAKMIKQRHEAAATYEEAGRAELAEQERNEVAIISDFMPQQMSDAEITEAVSAAIAELGASSLKDMGGVMGALKAKFAGQMDFAKASAQVKEKLS